MLILFSLSIESLFSNDKLIVRYFRNPEWDIYGNITFQREIKPDEMSRFKEYAVVTKNKEKDLITAYYKNIYGNIEKEFILNKWNKLEKIKFNTPEGKIKNYILFNYDEKGNMVSCSAYNKFGKVINTLNLEYFSDGKKKTITKLNSNQKVVWIKKFEYNDRGKKISETKYSRHWTRLMRKEYSYSPKGYLKLFKIYKGKTINHIKKFGYKGDGTRYELNYVYKDNRMVAVYKALYNKDNKLLEYIKYNDEGWIIWRMEYLYDDRGRLIKEITYDRNDKIVKEQEFTY